MRTSNTSDIVLDTSPLLFIANTLYWYRFPGVAYLSRWVYLPNSVLGGQVRCMVLSVIGCGEM